MTIVRHTVLMYKRSMTNAFRSPEWILLGIFQPGLYLLLFAPLLDSMMTGGNALTVFTPGLLIMLSMYGSVGVAYVLVAELRSGVVERFRVTPVSRLAIVLGPVLSNVTILIAQCAFLIGLALLMGVRVEPVAAVLLLSLVAIIGSAIAALCSGLALLIKDENGVAAVTNTFILPILLLSGILLPLTFAPAIIKTIAAINPFSHIVEAARAIFMNDLSSPTIGIGFIIALLLAVLASWWATRLYRTAVA